MPVDHKLTKRHWYTQHDRNMQTFILSAVLVGPTLVNSFLSHPSSSLSRSGCTVRKYAIVHAAVTLNPFIRSDVIKSILPPQQHA